MSEFEGAAVKTAGLLEEKIRSHSARVGVVGLGYVGLPLAVEFARAGFVVTGIDISAHKVRRVNAGDSYVGDIPSAVLGPLVESGRLRVSSCRFPRARAMSRWSGWVTRNAPCRWRISISTGAAWARK